MSTPLRFASWRLFLALVITLMLSGAAGAVNPALSLWTKDISEYGTIQPGDTDQNPEIAVVGNTVHVIWQTVTLDGSTLRLYYRRSTNGGKSFGPRMLLHEAPYVYRSADKADNSPNLKRLAVDGINVHVVTTTAGGAGIVKHIYSNNNGTSFTSQTLYTANNDYRSEHVLVDAANGRVAVAWQRIYDHPIGYDSQSWIMARTSDDNGANFHATKTLAYNGPAVGATLRLADLKVLDDGGGGRNVYVLYTNIAPKKIGDQTFSNFCVQLAASQDNGLSYVKKLLQAYIMNPYAPPQDLQDNNYVPKIAAAETNVYVTWVNYRAHDPNPLETLYFRRSTDRGLHFGPTLNLSGTLPGKPLFGENTIAAQGNNVYLVFTQVDLNGNYPQIYLRSSTDSGASFGAAKNLTDRYVHLDFTGAVWPRVATQPGDATGAKMHVLWNYPAYVKSDNAGASVTGPLLLYPRGVWYGGNRPRLAVGADGVVHWVAEGSFVLGGGNFGDQDIFYRRLDPPATPAATPKSLYLDQSVSLRYDNLQIAASPYINFTSALTVEAWINPYASGGGYVVDKEGSNAGYRLAQNSDGLWAEIYTNAGDGWYRLFTYAPLPSNTWSHVALTYKAGATGNNLLLYLNGDLVGETRAEGNLKTSQDMLFVGLPYNNLGIYELRFWNTARAQAQIKNNMNKILVGTEPGLRAYLPLNGSTLDQTGHGNNGVLMFKETFQDR
jgi:hypothetical protein